jgi:excinuclease UvrABC helicase subunit UvrB
MQQSCFGCRIVRNGSTCLEPKAVNVAVVAHLAVQLLRQENYVVQNIGRRRRNSKATIFAEYDEIARGIFTV